jgi:hypothetical protein
MTKSKAEEKQQLFLNSPTASLGKSKKTNCKITNQNSKSDCSTHILGVWENESINMYGVS